MLADGRCSIYEHRPRTCRTYDCRVLPAAGFQHDEDVPVEIGRRASRWRFDYPDPVSRVAHAAVEAAATFLAEHPEVLPPNSGRPSLTRLAALAIEGLLVAVVLGALLVLVFRLSFDMNPAVLIPALFAVPRIKDSDWQEFRPAGAQCRLLMPGTPTSRQQPIPGANRWACSAGSTRLGGTSSTRHVKPAVSGAPGTLPASQTS